MGGWCEERHNFWQSVSLKEVLVNARLLVLVALRHTATTKADQRQTALGVPSSGMCAVTVTVLR